MKVAMMQPTFLPWQGYFELLNSCETFIFLDDFQFSLQSYQQRNRLFVNRGQADWCTVPVLKEGSFLQPLNQTVINNAIPWRDKLWRRITNNYTKADHFAEISPCVEEWLFLKTENLSDLNIGFIKLACQLMDIRPKFLYSSNMHAEGERSKLVLDLLKLTQATQYLSARGAFGYMHEDKVFPVGNIEVQFQNYNSLPYKQIGADGSFVPHLSVLDALFNLGPASTVDLIRKSKSRWDSWADMVRSLAEIKS
jgi:hypothetical protein